MYLVALLKHLNAQIRSGSVLCAVGGKNGAGKLNEVIKNKTLSVFSAPCDVGVAVLCQSEGGLTEGRARSSTTSQLWPNGAFPDDIIVTVRSLRAHRGAVVAHCLPGAGVGGVKAGWPARTGQWRKRC